MPKKITDSQMLGELGETAIKKIVLEMGMIYEQRGRLEAGIDRADRTSGPCDPGSTRQTTGSSGEINRQQTVYSRICGGIRLSAETEDLTYWQQSNIAVIIVVWRKSDNSAYWKDVTDGSPGNERRLTFQKTTDAFDMSCADQIGALTVDRQTAGVFVPPLNLGESAILNMLRIRMPEQMFVARSPFGSGRDARSELLKHRNIRHDWTIRRRRFISFFDPREGGTIAIVDHDQVEVIDTENITLNDDGDDRNDTVDLLRRTVEAQLSMKLRHQRKERLFYFRVMRKNKPVRYNYRGSTKRTSTKVVSVYPNKADPSDRGFVRHHAAKFRFERLGDDWFIVIEPSFYFTYDGFEPHQQAGTLLSGKKNSSATRQFAGK